MKTRKDIPEKYTWDFTHMFATEDAWEQAYAECEAAIPALAALRGTLGQGAESLYNAYEAIYAFEEKFARVAEYAMLGKVLDGGDPAAQKRTARVMHLGVQINTALSFLEPELMAIPEETLASYRTWEPLKKYAHILEDATRLRAHVLDEKSESILAQVQNFTNTPSDTYDMITNVEMALPEIPGEDGKPVQLTSGNFGLFRESKKKEVRDGAFEAMFGTYGKFINTFACLYAGNVKQNNTFAALRGYPSARAASLAYSNVPEEVYDALVQAVHEAIPSMNKYLALRAKVLKTDHLDVYDLYTPMVDDVEYPMPFEDGFQLVLKAVAPLGEDYVNVLRRAYEERWMDVYETPGKESGAFSSGVYGVHPYVKLNYTDALDDAFTLAHELGHAMHSYLSSSTQDYPNHEYHLVVAEVASTCNEVLLTKYLLSVETDKRRRAYILNHFLEGFRTTIFRQTLFAEFEQKAHELDAAGTPLTADLLSDVYTGLVKQYYSGAAFRDTLRYEWAYIPHFYNAFYVYQYATGFSSAVAIASHILETGDASDYRRFLSSGGSDYPINELKIAGVDLTSPEVVRNAMKVFDETIDELDALIG